MSLSGKYADSLAARKILLLNYMYLQRKYTFVLSKSEKKIILLTSSTVSHFNTMGEKLIMPIPSYMWLLLAFYDIDFDIDVFSVFVLFDYRAGGCMI